MKTDFEKEFPSFEDLQPLEDCIKFECYSGIVDVNLVQSLIKQACVDKAKVKKAIELHMSGNCIGSKCDCLKEILKELGL